MKQVSEHQERARQAIQEISVSYHPYDLETGAARSAETVASSLYQCFADIEAVAAETSLSERCLKKIAKAKRVVTDMVATVTFFWLTVSANIEALSLAPELEEAVYHLLLPAIYLKLVADKAATAEQRHHLQQLSDQLRALLHARDGPFSHLTQDECRIIEDVALECAQLFQRSSSCVEGRNGQLALRHHSLHRLSNRKLAASLTVTHNYFIKRCDGSTAALRFFGQKPRDLFEYVLDRVDLPARPAQKRSQPQRQHFLTQTPT
ncbi:MAG: hypothetical protein GY759_14045 [Chloroflexi bacterium]|nr:hypothetical protein [Chloroflexota bacterium]